MANQSLKTSGVRGQNIDTTADLKCKLYQDQSEFFLGPTGMVVKDITIAAGGLEFDSTSIQMGPSIDGPPSLRRFFGTVLSRR